MQLAEDGGCWIDELGRACRRHDPRFSDEHLLDAALSLCGGREVEGMPCFVVAIHHEQWHPRNPGVGWILGVGAKIWMVEGYARMVWPPQVIRETVGRLVHQTPRGWTPRALVSSYQERKLDMEEEHKEDRRRDMRD